MPQAAILEIDVESDDFRLLVARLKRFRLRTSSGLREQVRLGAEELRKEIVLHASGRPGPEIVTGAYTRGFTVETQTLYFANQWVAAVVTDEEQWRRLEFGFVGVDALGRIYDQPPFPHIQPAIEVASPRIQEQIERAALQWWGES